MAEYNCFKCGGSGRVSFRHIENGVCFTCAGSGKLSYQPKGKAWQDPHPELLVPATEASTEKQWNYLDKLCGENSDTARRHLKAAGAKIASQRYVSKAVMSRAIEIAKASVPVAA